MVVRNLKQAAAMCTKMAAVVCMKIAAAAHNMERVVEVTDKLKNKNKFYSGVFLSI